MTPILATALFAMIMLLGILVVESLNPVVRVTHCPHGWKWRECPKCYTD